MNIWNQIYLYKNYVYIYNYKNWLTSISLEPLNNLLLNWYETKRSYKYAFIYFYIISKTLRRFLYKISFILNNFQNTYSILDL